MRPTTLPIAAAASARSRATGLLGADPSAFCMVGPSTPEVTRNTPVRRCTARRPADCGRPSVGSTIAALGVAAEGVPEAPQAPAFRERNSMAKRGLVWLAGALAALAGAGVASANVPLTQVSSDPFTNTTSQHATELEPDTFAF